MPSPNCRLKIDLPDQFVTRRLCLREITRKDVEPFLDFMERDNQDYPCSYLGWEQKNYDLSEGAKLIKIFQQQTIRNYHIFRIGNPHIIIGEIMVTSDRLRSPRVAYYVSKQYRRNGYANEGYDAVMTYLLSHNHFRHIWGETDTWNKASQHFLMSKGFQSMGKRQSANFNLDEESLVFLRKTIPPTPPR